MNLTYLSNANTTLVYERLTEISCVLNVSFRTPRACVVELSVYTAGNSPQQTRANFTNCKCFKYIEQNYLHEINYKISLRNIIHSGGKF